MMAFAPERPDEVSNKDILNAINQFANMVEQRFVAIEARLDRVEQRLDALEARVSNMETSMVTRHEFKSTLEDRLGDLRSDLNQKFNTLTDTLMSNDVLTPEQGEEVKHVRI